MAEPSLPSVLAPPLPVQSMRELELSGPEDFIDIPEDFYEEGVGLDPYFEDCYEELGELYEEKKDSVFYKRQLQVKFENKYFHWVTSNALTKLKNEGVIKEVPIKKEDGTSRQFFVHPVNRYYKRIIKAHDKIIDQYSRPEVTRSCGHRAEDLFSLALMERGFRRIARKVKEFNGNRWDKSGHDLDFIFERNGNCWGCEIKNTLGYIEKSEMEIKLEMCSLLGLRPLFIMRASAKTYNYEIIQSGGYVLIFGSQIYDVSQRELVERMRNELGLPVDCPTAIPSGIIDRFENWFNKMGL